MLHTYNYPYGDTLVTPKVLYAISMLTEPCSMATKSNLDEHLGWQFISWAETCDVRYDSNKQTLWGHFSVTLLGIFGQFQVAEKYQYPTWSNSGFVLYCHVQELVCSQQTFWLLLVEWNLCFCVMQYLPLPSKCTNWYAMRWLQADTLRTFSTTNSCCLLGTNRFVGVSSTSTPHGRSLTCCSSSIDVMIQWMKHYIFETRKGTGSIRSILLWKMVGLYWIKPLQFFFTTG